MLAFLDILFLSSLVYLATLALAILGGFLVRGLGLNYWLENNNAERPDLTSGIAPV